MCLSGKAYLGAMIWPKSGHRTNCRSEWGKKLPKNCWKIVNIPIYYAIIQMLFYISTAFCVSEKKHTGYHDFKQKSGHRTNSWSEWVKNLPQNCQKLQILLFPNAIIPILYIAFQHILVFTRHLSKQFY